MQQLHLLRHHQRAKLRGKAFGEIGVGEDGRPVRAAAGIVVEFPEMDDLVDRSRVTLELADQVLVVPALLQRREAELLVEFDRLGHLADVERVGPELVERHG